MMKMIKGTLQLEFVCSHFANHLVPVSPDVRVQIGIRGAGVLATAVKINNDQPAAGLQ
jgi:hypothetical protein